MGLLGPERESGLRHTLATAVNETLPALAAAAPGWPVRLNHCFRRIVYDAVAGGPWRDRWPAPAVAHMTEAELRACLDLCARLGAEGAPLCRALNTASLRARREASPHNVATARAAWS